MHKKDGSLLKEKKKDDCYIHSKIHNLEIKTSNEIKVQTYGLETSETKRKHEESVCYKMSDGVSE